MLQLPKTLWELGASNLPTTEVRSRVVLCAITHILMTALVPEVILRFLLRLRQRGSSLLRPEVRKQPPMCITAATSCLRMHSHSHHSGHALFPTSLSCMPPVASCQGPLRSCHRAQRSVTLC